MILFRPLLWLVPGLVAVAAVLAQPAPTPRAAVPASPVAGSAYAVDGIAVDVTARSVDEARRIAWGQAQMRAWPLLWSRLSGRPATEAPVLAAGTIDAMVAGIESQGEAFSGTRYIARLGVVFDRSRAAPHLGEAARLHSPPILLVPVLVDGGAAIVAQGQTPWHSAWARLSADVTLIDYVLPQTTGADRLWLTAAQLGRSDAESWRTILARADAVDVLVAEARLVRRYPGGPVLAHFTARHGAGGAQVARLSLQVASEQRLDRLLDEGARRLDIAFAAAWREGRIRGRADLASDVMALPDAPLIGSGGEGDAGNDVLVAVITPDNASLATAQRLLRAITPDVLVRQVAPGGTSRIGVSLPGGEEALRAALAQRGWLLEGQGADLVMRRQPPVLPTNQAARQPANPPQ